MITQLMPLRQVPANLRRHEAFPFTDYSGDRPLVGMR